MKLSVEFYSTDWYIDTNVGEIFEIFSSPIDAEVYAGEYVVVPKINQIQELKTKQKFLTDNIKIKEIPIYITTNASGGNSVYIGKEVMIDG